MRATKLLTSALAVLLALSAAGCTIGAKALAAPAEAIDPRLAEANLGFALTLYRELLAIEPRPNLFISPVSIGMALAMTYNGAAGTTQAAMAKALGLDGLTLEELNAANAELLTILNNPDPKLQLKVANSIWAERNMTFLPDFLERNERFYQAEVTALDFADPQALLTINSWVKRQTNGKIDRIINQLDPMDVMVLVNAVYFKGNWTDRFDPAATREGPFTVADGSVKQHLLMHRTGQYRYLEGDGFQAVGLPYGGGRVSMYVFLPSETSSLDSFHARLTPEAWQEWMAAFSNSEVRLALPKFRLEYDQELTGALTALGMGIAFEAGRADFSGMCPPPARPYIGEVKHKTYVDVNEAGTEAAGVTAVTIRVTAMPRIAELTVNRPFFFAIRDDKTGTLLFMGSVADPR
ncbi:MAG: serpin family protein [Bacillota bacterium]